MWPPPQKKPFKKKNEWNLQGIFKTRHKEASREGLVYASCNYTVLHASSQLA